MKRLSYSTEWDQVGDAVKPTESLNGYALELTGKLSLHSKRAKISIGNRKVTLVVTLADRNARDTWVDLYRIILSPWQLLYRSVAQNVLESTLSSDVLCSLFSTLELAVGNNGTPPETDEKLDLTKTVDKIGLCPIGTKTLAGLCEDMPP